MRKLLALLLFGGSSLLAVAPDCSSTVQFTNDPTIQPNGSTIIQMNGAPAPAINNNLGGSACQAWTIFYSFSGVTASSVELDTSATASGTFSLFPGTVNYGANPYQKNTNGYVNLTGTYNYLRFGVKYVTGTGTITAQAYGWINPANVGSIVAYPANGGAGGTSGAPDCTSTVQFTNDPSIQANGSTIIQLNGAPAPPINNNLGGSACQAWTLLYSFAGLTGSSVEIDVGSTTSGPFTLWPGTVNYGSDPYPNNRNGYVNLTGTYNYLRPSVKYSSGAGTVTIQAFGWINPAKVGSISSFPLSSGSGPSSIIAGSNVTISQGSPCPSGPCTINSSGGGSGGPTILATALSSPWVCDGTTVNGDAVIAATNAWFLANDNGTMIFPRNSTCLFSGQTSTSSIVVNTMMLGAGSANIIGDNTVMIAVTEAGSNNINFQSGQSEFNCFSGSVTNPTINYDFTAARINTVAAGSTTITFTTPSDAASYNGGDRLLIYGADNYETAGGGGFPPSYKYFERPTIVAINHSTGVTTLSAPLQFSYNSTMYFKSGNSTPPSARDLSLSSCPGGGGTVKRPKRIYVQGMDFSQVIPSQASTQTAVVYAGGGDYTEFNQCKFAYVSPGEGGTVVFRNDAIQWMELDKLTDNVQLFNTLITGNVQSPSNTCMTSANGVLNLLWDHVTAQCAIGASPRNAVYRDSTFYSQSSQPYGYITNGGFGYQQNVSVINPTLYKNGVSQSGIVEANNGYNITVNTVPGANTFTVAAASASEYAIAQYGGAGVQIFNHNTGALLGVMSGDALLVGGLLTVSTNFTPSPGDSIDISSNPAHLSVVNPVAIDFDINSIPPAFDAGLTARFANFSMSYMGVTTVADLGACNLASTPATKWVKDATNQNILGSGGGSVTAPVYCSGIDQFSGIWNTVSAISTPLLNGIAQASADAVLDANTHLLTITSATLPITTGNGTPAPNGIIIKGETGQPTSGTFGEQAGTGATVSCIGGAGGSASTGALNGYGGPCDLEGGVAGSGSGTPGGVGAVHIQRTVAGQTDIGKAGGSVCIGAVSDGTCSNGLFVSYFVGAEYHNDFMTLNAGTTNAGIEAHSTATIASASTISPTTKAVQIVTGTVAISQINPPTGCASVGANCTQIYRAAGLWSFVSGTNIAQSYSPALNEDVMLTYDPTALLWTCVGCAAGGGSPAGSTNAIQYNNAGSFAGTTVPSQDSLVMTNASGIPGPGVAGTSGALCAGTGCSGGAAYAFDIVTSVLCRTAATCAPTGQQNWSSVAAGSIPFRVGGSLPATCTANQDVFYLTSAAAGQNINLCTATNVWTSVGGTAVPLTQLAVQAADTVVMNATGGSAVPAAVSMPTCTSGASLYNTSTHSWSCVGSSLMPAAAPTASVSGIGCAVNATPTGNGTAGTIAVTGAGAACAVTLTYPASSFTTGASCSALVDRTTPASANESATTTATVVFGLVALTLSDVLQFGPCARY